MAKLARSIYLTMGHTMISKPMMAFDPTLCYKRGNVIYANIEEDNGSICSVFHNDLADPSIGNRSLQQ
jgi:hypothetical protein